MKAGRVKLALVLAVFLGPLLASFVWYYGFGASLAPRARANHAPLVSPAVPLAEFSNAGGGEVFDLGMLRQKWHVVHALPAQCGADCEKALYHTRQVRLALGRRASRVRRIFLSPNGALLERLAADHPDAIRLLQSESGLEKQLAPVFKSHARGADDALLIDPLGNVMMVVPAGMDPRLLLKDLKKLLRVSRIG